MVSISKMLKNPAKFIFVLDKLGISKLIPDKPYIKVKYRASMGEKLDLENPKTFGQKLQWLKLYYRRPDYPRLVDKYEAKLAVAEIIGEEHIIPTLGVWDNVDDIDFDALPDQFVLKCTHDCGGLVICKDKSKLDIKAAKEKIRKSLKVNYYYGGREDPYKHIKPRVIAEKYMLDEKTADLRDYKFYCFDGKAKALFVAADRHIEGKECTFDFYDINWEHLDMHQRQQNAINGIEKPETFDKMVAIAEKLSQGMPHVRVDLYEVNGQNYFGEMTFFAGGGWVPLEPRKWEKVFGEWINLPEKIV